MYVSLSEIQIKEEEEAMNRPFTKVGDHFTCVVSVGWFPASSTSCLFSRAFHLCLVSRTQWQTGTGMFPALSIRYMFPALKKRKNFHPRVLQFTSFQELNVSLFSLFTYFPLHAKCVFLRAHYS